MLAGVNSRLAAVESVVKPISHAELDSVKEQRQAEATFAATLQNIGQLQPQYIIRRFRVDDSFKQSRREINLAIVLDRVIACFVVKNWKGNYKPGADGKFWLKRAETEDAINVEQIKSPLVEVQEQISLLHSHLVKSGAAVTKAQIKGYLVFTNKEIILDPEVREHESILVGPKTTQYAQSLRKTWGQYLTDPLKPSFFTGALSYKQIATSTAGLRKVGSWDRIGLVGGRVVDGDYKSCPALAFDRSKVSKITLVHQRQSLSGKLYAIAGYIPHVKIQLEKRGGRSGYFFGKELESTIEVPFNTELVFHFANEHKEATIPVNEIEYILLA